jgi:Zn-dependent protease
MGSSIWIVAPHLLIAVVLHEVAHGLAALALGDRTALLARRLTLNPIRHIDPFMTIMLPAMLILAGSPIVFGGAKPVPVNTANLRNPRRDMALVALAGPAVNIALAAIWVAVARLGFSVLESDAALTFLVYGVVINVGLAVFNLTPVPPLDGGRILVAVLPEDLAGKVQSLERYGIMIVILLLATGLLDWPFRVAVGFAVGLVPGVAS